MRPVILVLSLLQTLFGIKALYAETPHKVVIFGIDGLNNYRFDEAYTPHFEYLQQHGSWTMEARANVPLSSSPNWKSIITGSKPDSHRVRQNGFDKDVYRDNPSCESEPDMMPTIFTMVKRKDKRLKVGYFEHWGAFRRLVRGDKINRHFWWEFRPKPNVKRGLVFFKRKDPAITLIHVDQCDHAGHKYGHESPEYIKALEKADELLGMVIRRIQKTDGFENTTLLVLTDHGGKGFGHGPGTPQGMIIPFFIMGPGIKKGHEIKEVMVKNEDAAVAALKALGIAPHPCWTAKEIPEIYK